MSYILSSALFALDLADTDLNRDGETNTSDLNMFIMYYTNGMHYPVLDLNYDGAVDSADLGILLGGK